MSVGLCLETFKLYSKFILPSKEKCIVLNNAQRCYIFLPIRPSSGINYMILKKVKFVKNVLNLARSHECYSYCNIGILDILFCVSFFINAILHCFLLKRSVKIFCANCV